MSLHDDDPQITRFVCYACGSKGFIVDSHGAMCDNSHVITLNDGFIIATDEAYIVTPDK